MSRQKFRRSIASLDSVFRFLDSFANDHQLSRRDTSALALVTEELFTNMVRHNVTRREEIEISVSKSGPEILLELVDFDVAPFDPSSAPTPALDAPIEEREPGGLGLHLVKSLVDSMTYSYSAGDLRVSVIKTVENSAVQD